MSKKHADDDEKIIHKDDEEHIDFDDNLEN